VRFIKFAGQAVSRLGRRTNREALICLAGHTVGKRVQSDGKTVDAGRRPQPVAAQNRWQNIQWLHLSGEAPDEVHVYECWSYAACMGGWPRHAINIIDVQLRMGFAEFQQEDASTGPSGPFYPPTYQPASK